MISFEERNKSGVERWRRALTQHGCDTRVAIPAQVLSFDPDAQTVTARPAILEMVNLDALPTLQALPDLEDIPIVVPRAGGLALTLPVAAGDECLLVFADMCIDGWWQSGMASGQAEAQIDPRRHDLSDAFALLGPWSQPRVLSKYSTTSAQLRSEDGTVLVDVSPSGTITLQASAVIAASQAAQAQGLLQEAFYTWFTTVYMPSVRYNTVAPPLPTPTPVSTVLQGE